MEESRAAVQVDSAIIEEFVKEQRKSRRKRIQASDLPWSYPSVNMNDRVHRRGGRSKVDRWKQWDPLKSAARFSLLGNDLRTST